MFRSWVLLSLFVSGAANAAPDITVDPTNDGTWRMVGAYDATATMATVQDQNLGYVWEAPEGMTESCGPAKSPVGMGVFEAEAVANGLTPTLAILLERLDGGEGDLTPDDVRVALGNDGPEFILQPMVQPRFISVEIEGDGALRYKQLVRTQLEMELCMEHKVGRGWTGADGASLRQAFLLDPPDNNRADRRYFGGQKEPVPGLLGPSDACLMPQQGFADRETGSGQGEGSIQLVPSDVWGATLRWCRSTAEGRKGAPVSNPDAMIPMNLSGLDAALMRKKFQWKKLNVNVGAGLEDDVLIDVEYDDQRLMTQGPLFPPMEATDEESDVKGLTDVLAMVPHTYPSVGPSDDSSRYVLLLVPNWQLVEGIRRLTVQEAGQEPDASTAEARVAEGLRNGVAWILDHPEMLFVQVEGPSGGEDDWRDLTQVMGKGSPFGPRNWGYTAGLMAGRQPIVLPVDAVPTWEQANTAQRARQQSFVLLGMVVVLGFVVIGVRRIPELWASVPEERADYWPARKGKGEEVEEEEVEGPGRNLPGADG